MLHWEGVAEFIAVAERGSFTAAAKVCGISVAQVSRLIAALEKRLGSKLLNRTTRKVSLTEAGQIYYQHCKPLLEGLINADAAITQLNAAPRGQLRLTAPVSWGETQLAPLLNRFAAEHPAIEIECTFTNRTLDLVDEGFDLAIRLGQLDDSSMMARRLGTRTLHCCATPAYLHQHGTPETLHDLKQHICLRGTYPEWRFAVQGQPHRLKVQGRIRYNSGFALLDAARQHLGLVQLPDYYVSEALESGELEEVLEKYRAQEEGIWALWPYNRQLTPKVRALVEFLSDAMAAEPPPHSVQAPA